MMFGVTERLDKLVAEWLYECMTEQLGNQVIERLK